MSGSNGNGKAGANGNGKSPKPNGRDGKGRFTKGNPGGPGNPQAANVARLRARMWELVSEDDFDEIVCQLVSLAKVGEEWAVKEFFNRFIGKVKETIDIDANVSITVAEFFRAVIEEQRGASRPN